MAIKTLALLLVATGMATALYRQARRHAPQTATPGSAATARPAPADAGGHLPDLSLDTAGLDTGGTSDHEDLLTPPQGAAQQSPNIRPGLPDFARGA